MNYQVKYKKLHPDAVLPTKLNENAGYDLHLVEDFELLPFTPALIPIGFSTEFPNSLEAVIRPRGSSLPKRRIHVAIGTVDAGFRNEWCVSAMYIPFLQSKSGVASYSNERQNFSKVELEDLYLDSYLSGNLHLDTLFLRKGERIAQVVFQFLPTIEWQEVEELGDSVRGMDGFGSSGR